MVNLDIYNSLKKYIIIGTKNYYNIIKNELKRDKK